MPVKIGELARLAGCQPVTIRYYEKEGLLKASERTASNYRLYEEDDIEKLRFIRHCRQHGISIAEIRDLLAFNANPKVNCDWIDTLIAKHIAEVEARMADLAHLKKHLESLRQKCSGGKKGDCGIMEELKHCQSCPYCQKLKSQDV